MKAEIVAHTEFGAEEYTDHAGYQPEPAPVNPLLLVHRCLRGRYLLAIVLGGLLAAPLAGLGYVAIPPKYTSVGRINIAPTRPFILYENEFTERLSSFDSYVQSQSNTLKSQRVLAAAASSPSLRDAGWNPLPRGLVDLAGAIEVSVPRGGQDVFVRVTWTDPRLAQIATNAILDEYQKIAIDNEASQTQAITDTVRDLREEARLERDNARSRAYDLAEREGTDDLVRLREAKHELIQYLEAMLLQIDMQLPPDDATNPISTGDDPASLGQSPEEVSPELLAESDHTLEELLGRHREAEYRLAGLRQRYGPAHRYIVSLEDDLVSLQTLIDTRVAITITSTPGGVAGRSPEDELRLRRLQVQTRLDLTSDEARRIGRTQLEIDRFREEAARADEKFREADRRLESRLVQQRDGEQGRISIFQRADTPLRPSTDRRLPLAAMGAMGGGGIGVGLVVLYGVLRPRYRYIGDIEHDTPNIRIIGAIPEIDATDPLARKLVATSVHQIRTAIDARLLGAARGGLVHVITSASAGEGKSTVCLRLARSFAISGKRTLIIDADLIGRRVTSKFGMGSSEGFAGATINGTDPLDAVHATDEDNLFLMPAGPHSELSSERVSVAAVARLLDTLRAEFGAVVIDTGPILGSIEAQAIVPASDEVLLVVTRGRGVRLVKLAIDQLHRLGTARVGIVFNRATFEDLERSTSISMTSQRVSERQPESDPYSAVVPSESTAPSNPDFID